MTDLPPERPAEDFDTLRGQVSGALEQLQREGGEATGAWRGYLRQLMSLTWRRMSRGDLKAPREALHALEPAQRFIERHLPKPQGAREEAAREFHQALTSLKMAERAAESAQLDADLRDRPRSEYEWKVLRVLSESQDRFLRRGEILKELRKKLGPGEKGPTGPRVSQILERLHHQGLLLRSLRTARGAREVGFYALSETGQQFVREHREKQAVARSLLLPESPGSKERKHIISLKDETVASPLLQGGWWVGDYDTLAQANLSRHYGGLDAGGMESHQPVVLDACFSRSTLECRFHATKPVLEQLMELVAVATVPPTAAVAAGVMAAWRALALPSVRLPAFPPLKGLRTTAWTPPFPKLRTHAETPEMGPDADVLEAGRAAIRQRLKTGGERTRESLKEALRQLLDELETARPREGAPKREGLIVPSSSWYAETKHKSS